MNNDPEIEVIYSGDSDAASDSKSPSRSSREADDAGSRAINVVVVSTLSFVMSCSAHPTSQLALTGINPIALAVS